MTTRTGERTDEDLTITTPSSLHVLDSLEPGGAQNVALDLADWLVHNGAPVTIAGPRGPLVDRLPRGVGFAELPGGAAAPVRLARLVARHHPAVLHAHQRRQALDAGLVGRVLRVPVVEHAHSVLPPGRTDAALRPLSFRSRAVFSVGENVTRMVTDDFGRDAGRVLTIGNAPSSRSATPARPWSPDPDGPLRLLGIGRLVEQKDPERFVRVVAAVARTREVRARWLGDGPLLERVRALAAADGVPVEFPGQSDDVTEELDASDALVMTSRWEGNPLVALEAFLRRRIVISTAASGVVVPPGARPMVVVPDGSSPERFAAAILSAFRHTHVLRDVIDEAHRHVAAEYTPDRVFAPVLATYRRLCVGRDS